MMAHLPSRTAGELEVSGSGFRRVGRQPCPFGDHLLRLPALDFSISAASWKSLRDFFFKFGR
jgi:hypothetical protein